MGDVSNADLAVFWIVVALRFFVPLLIPRYPLPAIVAALVIDGIDQTIFQTFTSLNLDSYQSYDKALDIYYLTIAYISTLRNWSHLLAFQVSRFLFYWRLVGAVAFELTGARGLLLIFPNTFEYFFLFYEAVRLRWDPHRMSRNVVIGAAAFIWIVIKLPQEWWLHVHQGDATDTIKAVFGYPPDAPWTDVIGANLGAWLAIVAVVVVLLVAAWWFVKNKLPPSDRGLSFDADAHKPGISVAQLESAMASQLSRIVSWALVEKVAMVSLVTIIFAQVLPNVRLTTVDVVIGVAFVIVLNTVVSHWLSRRGTGFSSSLVEFVAMAAVNFGSVLVFDALWRLEGDFQLTNALVFVLLLTVLVVLYDRYWPVHEARRQAAATAQA